MGVGRIALEAKYFDRTADRQTVIHTDIHTGSLTYMHIYAHTDICGNGHTQRRRRTKTETYRNWYGRDGQTEEETDRETEGKACTWC